MKNNWKQIWSNRMADKGVLLSADKEKIFLELKKADGFDLEDNGLNSKSFFVQYEDIKNNLSEGLGELKSVYEIGCGAGANLFMFESEGIKCGGIDYSSALIDICKTVVKSEDIVCDEASKLDCSLKYDALLSNSVFTYFEDEEYARVVLEKMYEKTNYSIGLIDVHDKEKEQDFLEFRKREIENFEEKYAGLPKLFFEKEFFIDFAKKHNMKIKFTESVMDGYWNNEFIFNCFMYKS